MFEVIALSVAQAVLAGTDVNNYPVLMNRLEVVSILSSRNEVIRNESSIMGELRQAG